MHFKITIVPNESSTLISKESYIPVVYESILTTAYSGNTRKRWGRLIDFATMFDIPVPPRFESVFTVQIPAVYEINGNSDALSSETYSAEMLSLMQLKQEVLAALDEYTIFEGLNPRQQCLVTQSLFNDARMQQQRGKIPKRALKQPSTIEFNIRAVMNYSEGDLQEMDGHPRLGPQGDVTDAGIKVARIDYDWGTVYYGWKEDANVVTLGNREYRQPIRRISVNTISYQFRQQPKSIDSALELLNVPDNDYTKVEGTGHWIFHNLHNGKIDFDLDFDPDLKSVRVRILTHEWH